MSDGKSSSRRWTEASRGRHRANLLPEDKITLGAVRFGELQVERDGGRWSFSLPVHLGGLSPEEVRVELYADPIGDEDPMRQAMEQAPDIAGGYIYRAGVPAARPASHSPPPGDAFHPDVRQPAESSLICWQR